MPDDEPLDDARAVAVAAAAAAARVIEVAARAAADRNARQLAGLQRGQDQQRARAALGAVRQSLPLTAEEQLEREANFRRAAELEQAEAWARTGNPEAWKAYGDSGADTPGAHRPAEDALIWRWKNETKPYDDPERREAANGVRKTAGVPAEARDVRAAADLMTGHEPRRHSSLKDPNTWYKTGSEPATKRQRYTLQQLGVDSAGLTKAGASKIIAAPEDARAVMVEMQRARDTADRMNGTSPAEAAARSRNVQPASKTAHSRQPGRQADQGR